MFPFHARLTTGVAAEEFQIDVNPVYFPFQAELMSRGGNDRSSSLQYFFNI